MASNDLSFYDESKVPNAKNFKFGLVVSEWNEEITQGLFQGAFDAFMKHGVFGENIVRWNVPGSFELIYGCKKLSQTFEMLDVIIAIGSVVQGETKHFDFVCDGVTQGIKDLNIQAEVPIIYCVLTDNNIEQSKARSGGEKGNKGVEAAIAAIKMAQLRKDAHFYKGD